MAKIFANMALLLYLCSINIAIKDKIIDYKV